ncbi:MAG: response regulator [Phycisphaerales bacterium]|nr:response regulator [Phycisphaerales bacterium]
MTPGRPKLLIVGGPNVPAEELRAALGDRYDVTESGPGGAAEAIREGGVEALLADAGSLSPVSADLSAAPAIALLDSIGDALCLAREDGSVVWANERFRSLDGPAQAEIAGVCAAASRVFAEARGRNKDDGQPPTCKFDVLADQGRRVLEVFVTRVDLGGEAGHVAAVGRDVTAIRRTQQKMDAIDRAGSELVGFEADSVRQMNAIERLRLLEHKIVRTGRELLHFDNFAIRLIDERTRKLEMVICSGIPPEVADFDLYPELEGSGISGYVAATGRSYVCKDTETDEKFLPGLAGARSSLTVPLRLHDKVIGIWDIESQKPGAFTDEDRQFGEIFARYIAIALHMLDLLVVERSAVNQSVSGRVEGELRECLEDIISEAEWLSGFAARDPETASHVARIKADVEKIRARVRNVAAGPQTLLGAERALAVREKDPALVGKRVLVADDEPKIRRIIRDVLRNRGATVTVCENGAEAIERLLACARGEEPPFDLVLSDIKMPDRNGYEVFNTARTALPGVPVILMTGFGYDPHHSIVRASQEGLQSVLFKPFQIERLIDEARKAVTGGGGTP